MALVINNPTALGKNASTLTNQASIAKSATASCAIGDLVIVIVGYGLGSTPTSISVTDDAGGNTYTKVDQADKITNNTPHCWMFYSKLATALTTSNTITAAPSTNFNLPQILLTKATVTGGTWDTTTVDKHTSATGASAAPNSGTTSTTATAAQLLIGGIEMASTAALTWDSPWVAIDNQATAGSKEAWSAYRVVSSTGTYSASGTVTSGDWAAVIGTFSATASGGVTATPMPGFRFGFR